MNRYLIVLFLSLLLLVAGCPVPPQPKTPTYSTGTIRNPTGLFASVQETTVDITVQADTYELPITIDEVINFDRDINPNFSLSTVGIDKLQQNGFVAIENGEKERFSDAYSELNYRDIPIFITADSTLHLYHIFFSQILKNVEIKEFIPMLKVMTKGLVETSWAQYEGSSGKLKEAAKKNVAYFSVAAKLMDPDYAVPSIVFSEVNEELSLIEAHESLDSSPIFSEGCPCDPCSATEDQMLCIEQNPNCYCEDYSQYIPRGHYTQTEDLKRYFKTMMWFGRMGLRIKSDRETTQAVLLTDVLKATNVNYKGQEVPTTELWYKIYRVTSFFVGAADDLTFYEYDKAVVELFGEGFDETILEDESNLNQLKEKLKELREPEILSGYVLAFLDNTEQTQGLRFMGQRYAPDSYVLGQVVFKNVGPNPLHPDYEYVINNLDPLCKIHGARDDFTGCSDMTIAEWNYVCCSALGLGKLEVCRLIPKGLDVMSILGSSKADELLEFDKGYCNYESQMNSMKQEFSQYSREDWTKNLYWSWLYVLQPLLEEYDEGYPVWMQTDAWEAKGLHTALVSWVELRHDTILYVKQSYTSGMGVTAVRPPLPAKYYGYVEPVPEFYARLKDLTTLTKQGLKDLDVLESQQEESLGEIEELLLTLKTVSEKELTNQELTEEEYDVINNIGDTFSNIIEKGAKVITEEPSATCVPPICFSGEELEEGEAFKTTLIADVHTDPNTESVLEEASGYVDWIIVVHKSKDGSLGAAVGPIFTYYEFTHPMRDRLTDEKWREMLSTEPPARPDWVAEFYE